MESIKFSEIKSIKIELPLITNSEKYHLNFPSDLLLTSH